MQINRQYMIYLLLRPKNKSSIPLVGQGSDIPSEPTSSGDRRAQRRSKARSGTGATRSFLRLAKSEHGEDRPFGQSEHVDSLRTPARGSLDWAGKSQAALRDTGLPAIRSWPSCY